MAEDFYNTWLGVAPGPRPPNHYRLLGVALWCDDPALLERAARAQLAKLDRYAIHQDPAKRAACNRLMNEVAKARVVLASPQRRAVYDRDLSRRLGIAMPAAEVAAAEVVFDDAAEQEADTDAEAYLNAIASAAGATARKRRKRPAQRNTSALPIALVVAGVVLITGLSIWLFWQPSGQHAQAAPPADVGPVDQTPVAPPVVSRPRPSLPAAPPVMGKLFGLAEGQPPAEEPAIPAPTPVAPAAVAPSPATPALAPPSSVASSLPAPSAPPSSPAVEPAIPPAVVRNLATPAAPIAGSTPVAWTSQMNAMSDWTVVRGDWQTTPDGRFLGKGDSEIDFKPQLPANVAISFHLRVLDGMRPRVMFGGAGIFVGNEGSTKNLMVHGTTKDATGHSVPYELNQDMAVRVMFLPDDRYSIRVNDQVMTGRRAPGDGKIGVRVRGGDSGSKGSTEFWDFKVGAVSVVQGPAVTVASAGATTSSYAEFDNAPVHGEFITAWRIIGPFPTQKDTTRGLDFMTPVEDAAGFPGDGSIDWRRELTRNGKSFKWIADQTRSDGTINLTADLGVGDWLVGYAYSEYRSATARDTVIWCGSDDGIKVWINGVVVHQVDRMRQWHWNDDEAPIHLRAGINHVLVKCDNYRGNWGFSLAIRKPAS